jgi:hypothetical protein
MPMQRGDVARRRGWARPGLGAIALLAVLLALVAMAPMRHPSFRYRSIEADGDEFVPPASVPSCAAILSNASLDSTYAAVYSNLPNVTRNSTSGPNETAPVGQVGYPSLAVGGLQLQVAWNSICSSSAFQSTYRSQGASAVQSGMSLNLTTGYFQASYGFAWPVPCTKAVGSNEVCERSILWYVNLSTGAVNGPVTTNWGTAPLPGASGGSGSSWIQAVSNELGPTGMWSLAAVVAALAVGLGGVGVASRHRRRTGTLPIHDSDGSLNQPRSEVRAAVTGAPRHSAKNSAGVLPATRSDLHASMNSSNEDPLADVY